MASSVGEMSRRRAIGAQAVMVGFFGHINKRHRVRGVRGVRAAGHRVHHQLGVAVVGGDQPAAVPSRLMAL